MKARRAFRSLLLLALPALMLGACNHKDLCFDHPEHASRYESRVEAQWDLRWELPETGGTDWSAAWPADFGISYASLNPAVPEGLCVNAYGPDGRTFTRHLPPQGGVVEMAPGENSMLMYNDDTEFIIFDNLSNSVSAKATTRARSRASYFGNSLNKGSRDETEKTVTPPDPLFGHYIESYEQLRTATPPTIDVTMRPLVFTYLVRYIFDSGADYIALARGAMSGMAESVYLFDGHTGADKATILYDCTVHPWGVEAVVNSFGIPNYPNPDYSRAGEFYGLNLELRLTNGKTITFDHDVSTLVAAQPHGGVIEVRGLSITPEQGASGPGSGFDVTVEGWGEYEDVPIDM